MASLPLTLNMLRYSWMSLKQNSLAMHAPLDLVAPYPFWPTKSAQEAQLCYRAAASDFAGITLTSLGFVSTTITAIRTLPANNPTAATYHGPYTVERPNNLAIGVRVNLCSPKMRVCARSPENSRNRILLHWSDDVWARLRVVVKFITDAVEVLEWLLRYCGQTEHNANE